MACVARSTDCDGHRLAFAAPAAANRGSGRALLSSPTSSSVWSCGRFLGLLLSTIRTGRPRRVTSFAANRGVTYAQRSCVSREALMRLPAGRTRSYRHVTRAAVVASVDTVPRQALAARSGGFGRRAAATARQPAASTRKRLILKGFGGRLHEQPAGWPRGTVSRLLSEKSLGRR